MKERYIPRPSKGYRKAIADHTAVNAERRKAAAVHARAAQRTPSHSPQRKADNASIAEYLARVPPRNY